MLVATLFHSCSNCWCSKTCYLYNNDSIEICRTNELQPDTNFTKLYDSLNHLYGQGRDTILGMGHLKYGNSQMRQLEAQGYNCECPR